MNHSENKKQQHGSDAEDKALDKLEEMWDRQILKGDDEFYESRIRSKPEGTKDDLKGQAIAAFVILKEGFDASQWAEEKLKEHVQHHNTNI